MWTGEPTLSVDPSARVDDSYPAPRLLTGRDIADALASLDRHALKRFGQNFVIDPNLVGGIVRDAQVDRTVNVVEIGPGLGSLTIPLVHAARRVVAVEIDSVLAARLEATIETSGAVGELDVVVGDALDLSWRSAVDASDGPWILVGNLPYNIGATLVLDVLEKVADIERLVVMVQLEVAERLAADPGTKAASGASVVRALHADARIVRSVPAEVFSPRPRVSSAIIELRRVDRGLDPQLIARVGTLVSAGFGQRRKTLRASVGPLIGVQAMADCDVDSTRRAETLTLEEWCRLAEVTRTTQGDGT